MAARCFLFFCLKTNSLLESQNSFIDLTFTQLERVQIKIFQKNLHTGPADKSNISLLISSKCRFGYLFLFAAYADAEAVLWKPCISLVKEALFDTV